MVFVLQNTNGVEAHISSYGCMLMRFICPDRNGLMGNIVLGLETEEDYRHAGTNYGGVVGRYANRIGGGGFALDGNFYPLPLNLNNSMHLHGGTEGFDQKDWVVVFHDNRQVVFQYQSQNGEEGYPGTVDTTVTYTLNEDNSLEFQCEATTDRPTVVSLSHHAYFNLSGDMSNNIKGHTLWISAEDYLEADDALLPLHPSPVHKSPFDFREEKTIGQDLHAPHPQLALGNGYDHCFVLGNSMETVQKVAKLYHPESGRSLEIETNKPGIQLYTANWLSPNTKDYKGVPLQPYHAVCLEPQHFPDAPNRPDFPSPVLRPGEIYHHKTIFRAGIRLD